MGFRSRNLKDAPVEIREMAYKTMAHPQVEYCSTVWDLYTVNSTHRVEKVNVYLLDSSSAATITPQASA